MGSLSIWHWLIVLIVVTIPIPVAKLLHKTGRSGWWALLYFLPLLNIIFLWIWAFSADSLRESDIK
jgi:uncharacterized membrane protein YhaH (DUF805 family)